MTDMKPGRHNRDFSHPNQLQAFLVVTTAISVNRPAKTPTPRLFT